MFLKRWFIIYYLLLGIYALYFYPIYILIYFKTNANYTFNGCSYFRSPVKWALLGDNDLGSNKGAANPQVREIVQRILHPNYKPPSMYNDIGLFRLSTPVQFNRFVFPACINTEVHLTAKQAIAIGWGRTSSGFYVFFCSFKHIM